MISNAPSRRTLVQRCLVGAAGISALVVAGCSSGGNGGGASSAPAGGGQQQAGSTVSVGDVGGMSNVLTDTKGRTLYVSDQESGGKVLCASSDCTAIWTPLTVASGQKATGPDSISGKLTTVMRSDGKAQVALDGQPLYTFSFDHGAGDVNGDGEKDSFGGTDFTWHAATATGPAAGGPASSSSDSGGGGGYGGGY